MGKYEKNLLKESLHFQRFLFKFNTTLQTDILIFPYLSQLIDT